MSAQALFISCGLMSLGMIFAIIGAIQLRIPLQSLRWRTTPGEITRSTTEHGGSSSRQYDVRYRYSVHGQMYSGSRISFRADPLAGILQSSGTAVVTDRYPRGAQVKVYYDPAQPDRSVLEPGVGLASYLPLAAGGLLFIVGLIAGMFAFI